jgi:hypothetical protein
MSCGGFVGSEAQRKRSYRQNEEDRRKECQQQLSGILIAELVCETLGFGITSSVHDGYRTRTSPYQPQG